MFGELPAGLLGWMELLPKETLEEFFAETLAWFGWHLGEVVDIQADYDDPGLREVDGRWMPEHQRITIERFPLRHNTGTHTVRMAILSCKHGWRTEGVLAAIEECPGLRLPDRAEAEAFLRAHPEEWDEADELLALCGMAKGPYIASVYAVRGEQCLLNIGEQYDHPDGRFLVVLVPTGEEAEP